MLRISVLLIAFLALTAFATAEVPQTINYQGRLTDGTGEPVADDTYDIKFNIYSSESGPGDSLWWSGFQGIQVTGGLFYYQLGSNAPLPDDLFSGDTIRYLGITVETNAEITPRSRLTSVAYAYHALRADTAAFAQATSSGSGWVDDGADVRLETDTDNVGIGTAIPSEKLEVVGSIKIVDGNEADGYVLTSDATGVGSWQAVGSTSKWTVSDNIIYTNDFWGIARGNADNELIGLNTQGHVNMGVACTTGVIGSDKSDIVISGGFQNRAEGNASTIGGGINNIVSGTRSTIGGGGYNRARGDFSVVAGGGSFYESDSNSAIGNCSAIGGGLTNTAIGDSSFIGGGIGNTTNSDLATIVGGRNNTADGLTSSIGGGYSNETGATLATIAGGNNNTASGDRSFIGGGLENEVTQDDAVVVGGYKNIAVGQCSFVGGGKQNKARGAYSVVAGGGGPIEADSNLALADNSAIGGGGGNIASNDYATVSGGNHNTASGYESSIGGGGTNEANDDYTTIAGGNHNTSGASGCFVGGGVRNEASIDYAVITGGSRNVANGYYSAIGGGKYNRTHGNYSVIAGGGGGLEADSNSALGNFSAVGGGSHNYANGIYSIVPGGLSNAAEGDYSFAAGRRGKANHDGAFVWADHTDADFSSTASDQFLIRATGGVGIGTNSPQAKLDISSSDDALRLRAGEDQSGSTRNQILFSYNGSTNYTHAIKSRHASSTDDDNALDFYVWDYGTDANTNIGTKHVMTVIGTGSGRVGINTTSPAYALDVNGDINCGGSYNVKKGGTSYTHPDYVFEPDYELMTVDELKEFVMTHKHLPNVISADEVKKNEGFKLDELLVQMLEKIEEQTLYIIQLDEKAKELEKLKAENDELKAQVAKLNSLMETVLANMKTTGNENLASNK